MVVRLDNPSGFSHTSVMDASESNLMSPVDRLISRFDGWLRRSTSQGDEGDARRPYPGAVAGDALSERERRLSAGLMRVNHAGEVAAQALYEGQALGAREKTVNVRLREAAQEEAEHLDWCERRLDELESAPSRLDPLWYAGSFLIGLAATARGDAASLGFVAETERQVVEHLNGHIERLPAGDHRTRAILRQMARDEAKHGAAALAGGGRPPPFPVRLAMRLSAKVMTRTSYWI